MLKKIFAILALASSGTALQAATLTYTAVVAPSATAYFNFTEPSSPAWWSGGPRVFTATNWSQNLALQKFDPALGTLNSVSITYRGSIYSRAQVESLDEEAVTVTESWSGTMGFTFPGGARQTSGLSYSLSQNFSAYDGTTDFGGTSGASLSPFFIESNSGNPITQTESTNLGSYIGTDTFSVPVDASGRARFAGAGNLVSSVNTYGWAGVTVTYDYTPPAIDLTIAKAVTSSGPYIVGSNVTYSLLARNLGPGTAQPAIVVKDQLPAGLTYVSASGTNWSCAAAGQAITCTRASGAGTLAANASADVITVTAKVAAGATGSLVNMAQVNPAANETLVESNPLGTGNNGYETGDPTVGSNNDDSKAITVVQAIDLTIAKSVGAGAYSPGSNVSYSLLARNLGPATAQAAIVVKDLLPAGLTYVSASGTNWSCTAAGQTVTCTRASGAGTLAANASADAITVVAKVDASVAIGTSLVNHAQVAPAANETVPESNPLGTANGGYEDGNPASGSNNDDSKAIVVAVPTAVPTLNEWMLLLLSVMVGLLAMRQAQGRRHMR